MADAVGRARVLLALGAATGLAVALWSALGVHAPDLARRDAAAVVNGPVIPRVELARAVEAIASDKRGSVTGADRRRALDTLIREELLVQRAAEIGLLRDDRSVRKAAVQAMLRMIAADVRAQAPDEATLREFYNHHPEIGRAGARLHVEVVGLASADGARELAADVRDGAGFRRAAARANAERVPAPDGLVPFRKLTDYLGGPLARIALGLDEGQIAGPVKSNGRHHLVWLLDREDASRPPFGAMRDTLERAWRRQREERAVHDYLERLWREARIEVSDRALATSE